MGALSFSLPTFGEGAAFTMLLRGSSFSDLCAAIRASVGRASRHRSRSRCPAWRAPEFFEDSACSGEPGGPAGVDEIAIELEENERKDDCKPAKLQVAARHRRYVLV